MNVEELVSRIRDLEEAKNQSIANVNAITGAIQENQYWLNKLTPTAEKGKLLQFEPAKPTQ